MKPRRHRSITDMMAEAAAKRWAARLAAGLAVALPNGKPKPASPAFDVKPLRGGIDARREFGRRLQPPK